MTNHVCRTAECASGFAPRYHCIFAAPRRPSERVPRLPHRLSGDSPTTRMGLRAAQLDWARRRAIAGDGCGYVPDYVLNLRAPLTPAALLAFERGGGSGPRTELGRSCHATSAGHRGAFSPGRPRPELCCTRTAPDGSDAHRFDDVTGPMVKRVARLADDSRTLAALRDARLPRLLSGKLRVRDAERDIAPAI